MKLWDSFSELRVKPLYLLRINFKDEDLCVGRILLPRTRFVLKQGASSHSLALRKTQRQREKVPLLKGLVNLPSLKEDEEKTERELLKEQKKKSV